MAEITEHFVDFNRYCWHCKHVHVAQDEDPCDECLNYPINTNSTKPVNFEPVED